MEKYVDTKVVGHEDTMLNEWSSIKEEIRQEIEGTDIFEEMKNLSKPQLGENVESISKCSAFFERLENNFRDEYDVIDFLINLTTHMELHIDLGTIRVAELLQKYRRKLEEFREKCYKEGLFKDRCFVGRKDDIKLIEQRLIDEKEVAFCICGMGGVGKTSVAREICINLWKRKKRWVPKKIDLREVRHLKDLLRDTLVRLGTKYEEKNTNMLTDQFFNILKNGLHDERTILFFDNIDDALEHDKKDVEEFIIQLVKLLKEMGNQCKIRILLTSRTKIQFLPEKELTSLDKLDAIVLLKKCTTGVVITEDQAQQIVSLCGCNPLALRTLSSSLKSRLITPRHMILNLHKIHKTCLTTALNVQHCIQQTFSSMEVTLQNILIQLSVFRTTPFDVRTASAILKYEEEFTTLNILCIKSRHLIEVVDKYSDSFLFDGDGPMISLHPIVYAFLREEVEKRENLKNILTVAELRYIEYFNKVAMHCGKTKRRNFAEFQTIFERRRPHLQIFFDLLTSTNNSKYNLGAYDIDCLSRISDLMLYINGDREMIRIAETFADSSFSIGDITQGMFWKVEQGIALLEEECINESMKVVEDTEECESEMKKSEIDQTKAKILGRLCYLKGRIFTYKRIIDKALECYNSSLKYYKPCSVKQVFSELAEVYNCIGTANFRKEPPDLQQAKFNHEKAMKLLLDSKAVDHPEKANYMANIASCLNVEANEMVSSRKPEEASPKLKKALQLVNSSLDLDVTMKRDITKAKDYAMKLVMRANIYLNMEDFDKCLEDNKEALRLRKRIFKMPNDLITISTHRVGLALLRKAMKVYSCNGAPDTKKMALQLFKESQVYYDEAFSMIKMGGLSKEHEEYIRIRDNHIKLVGSILRNPDLESQIKIEYGEYECGTYDRIANKIKVRNSFDCEQITHGGTENYSSSSDDEIMSSSNSSHSSTSSKDSDSDSEYSMERKVSTQADDAFTDSMFKTGETGVPNSCKTQDICFKSETITVKSSESIEAISEGDKHRISGSQEKSQNDKRFDSGISIDSETGSELFNRSISYQSSFDDVFTSDEKEFTKQYGVNHRRVDSGYSSLHSIPSTSFDFENRKKRTLEKSSSLPQSTSSNKIKTPVKRRLSQMTDFIDKITKTKTPKLSKGLLGDSFDESEEQK